MLFDNSLAPVEALPYLPALGLWQVELACYLVA